jgi:CRP/FNR family cyclic AMP-dependent transcriptional regulator
MEESIPDILHRLSLIVFMKKSRLFAAMKTSELRMVAQIATEISFGADEIIVRENDIGDAMYMIKDGSVKVTKMVKDGGSVELAALASGDCFGEMSMFDAEVRSATVTTCSPGTILRIGSTDMFDMLHDNPAIGIEFIRIFVNRLREANGKIEAQATGRLS